MGPLDLEARMLVASAAKRVSVVTAISPRAAVDMLFVLVNAFEPDPPPWRSSTAGGPARSAC